mmetsp:Transcript_30703/g.69893  ORF Transcript_30703/g.69893 Transcript_30703/m.69893 type:complete len:365 (+) Transcript_30703:29-1123(+)
MGAHQSCEPGNCGRGVRCGGDVRLPGKAEPEPAELVFGLRDSAMPRAERTAILAQCGSKSRVPRSGRLVWAPSVSALRQLLNVSSGPQGLQMESPRATKVESSFVDPARSVGASVQGGIEHTVTLVADRADPWCCISLGSGGKPGAASWFCSNLAPHVLQAQQGMRSPEALQQVVSNLTGDVDCPKYGAVVLAGNKVLVSTCGHCVIVGRLSATLSPTEPVIAGMQVPSSTGWRVQQLDILPRDMFVAVVSHEVLNSVTVEQVVNLIFQSLEEGFSAQSAADALLREAQSRSPAYLGPLSAVVVTLHEHGAGAPLTPRCNRSVHQVMHKILTTPGLLERVAQVDDVSSTTMGSRRLEPSENIKL